VHVGGLQLKPRIVVDSQMVRPPPEQLLDPVLPPTSAKIADSGVTGE
jgi:hypothetical protein